MKAVCRLCLKLSEKYESIDDTNVPTNRQKIASFLPEVAIDLVDDYVLCSTCSKRLQEMHEFKSNCLEIEEVVKNYVEKNGRGTRVNLIDVVINVNLTDNLKPIEFVHCGDDYNIVEPKIREIAVEFYANMQIPRIATREVVDGTKASENVLKCDVASPSKYNSRKHQVSHTKNCDVCGKFFKKRFGAKIHMADVHGCTDKTGKHKCDSCEARFVTENALAKHSKEHSVKKGYVCNVCGKELATPKHLRNHMRNHSEGERLKCEFCEMRFKDKHVLVTHLRCHTGEKPYKCERCGKGFAQSSTLYTHIRDVHIGEKRYACHLCPLKFKYQSSLRLHIAKHNGTVEKKHTCDTCNKSFLRAHGLRKHMLWHANVKNHACVACEKSFVELAGLKRHMITHTGEKPHQCHLCEFRCNQKSNLTIHMRSHGRKKAPPEDPLDEILNTFAEEPHQCHLCEFQCKEKSNLMIHMKSHGIKTMEGVGEEETFPKEPLQCQLCEFRCNQKSNLTIHMKSHGRKKL